MKTSELKELAWNLKRDMNQYDYDGSSKSVRQYTALGIYYVSCIRELEERGELNEDENL